MASKKDYIAVLRAAISRIHDCGAVHLDTVPVHEVFSGNIVWKGDVEVFELLQHEGAKRAYAWSELDGPKGEQTNLVVVLEIPPVKDATTAVQASIVS